MIREIEKSRSTQQCRTRVRRSLTRKVHNGILSYFDTLRSVKRQDLGTFYAIEYVAFCLK